jgi:hypothetical protein
MQQVAMDEFLKQFGILAPVVAALMGKYGSAFQLIANTMLMIGTIRTATKPLWAWFEARIKATSTLKDDEVLEKLHDSRAFRVLSFIFDYTLSVKLPLIAVAAQRPAVKNTIE